MYALSFDMNTAELKIHYDKRISNAYYEIKRVLYSCNFEWIQGSTYITKNGDMSTLFAAIIRLKKMEWFCKSVRDIRGYKIEDWSDFTHLVKEDI